MVVSPCGQTGKWMAAFWVRSGSAGRSSSLYKRTSYQRFGCATYPNEQAVNGSLAFPLSTIQSLQRDDLRRYDKHVRQSGLTCMYGHTIAMSMLYTCACPTCTRNLARVDKVHADCIPAAQRVYPAAVIQTALPSTYQNRGKPEGNAGMRFTALWTKQVSTSTLE